MLVQSAKTQIVKLVHFTICSAGTAGAAPNETGCGSLLGNLASKAQKPRQARTGRQAGRQAGRQERANKRWCYASWAPSDILDMRIQHLHSGTAPAKAPEQIVK